uniref:Dynein regulatory complex subunit 4 n=1 Tax=Trichobilharzia regenti TaxID=157069 RepID=A0AA85J1K2_TRIRE|nr:unnamed protein product [Trichobilharzia regenti]
MAPGRRKGKKNKFAIVINNVSTTDMTKEEIEAYVVLLREELEKEKQERNLALLEKQKISTFWELTKKQLDEARSLLIKKERDLEDTDEKHQLEMKIYRQKLKHVMFEQNTRDSAAKKEALQSLSNSENEARAEIRAIRNENYTLKVKLRQQLVRTEETIKQLKRQHELDIAHIRQDFSRQREELEIRAGTQMTQLRKTIDTQRRVEVHETEERKNVHIQNLEMNHEQAFANMKSYYNDVTLGNVSVIKTLRENIDELRCQLSRVQRLLDESYVELNKKKEELAKTDKENVHLRQIEHLYEMEKSAHVLTKNNAKKTLKSMKNLEDNYDLLKARFEALDKMRGNLAQTFEKLLLDVQQRMGLKTLLVERKLQYLAEMLETREAQVKQLLIALDSDPQSVEIAKGHLEDLLKSKNEAIHELQYEIMRMGKAYNELWSTCQSKLVDEMNSPINLGITPVKVNIQLISPFNPSTALGKKLNDPILNHKPHPRLYDRQQNRDDDDSDSGNKNKEKNENTIGKPKCIAPKYGKGPTGLASIAPF